MSDETGTGGIEPRASRRAVDVERIAARHLFGEVTEEPEVRPRVIDAPETALNLTLEGVFAADDPRRSAAIVADRSSAGELYLIGDHLPGNAILEEVHGDRIILRRGNNVESLRFDLVAARDSDRGFDNGDFGIGADELPLPGQFDEGQPAELSREPEWDQEPPPPASPRELAQEAVSEIRQLLEANPAGALEELGVTPVARGAAQGYRLGALANELELRQAGFQPDDVVLSVNGHPLGNVSRDLSQFEDEILPTGDELRFEVQRGNERLVITSALGPSTSE